MAFGSNIILQFGDYKLNDKNQELLDILFHEATHEGTIKHLLPKKINFRLPKKFTGTKQEYIDEIIHKSLWGTSGILSQKYFKLTEKEIIKRKNWLIKVQPEPYKSMTKGAFDCRIILQKYLKRDKTLTKVVVKEICDYLKK